MTMSTYPLSVQGAPNSGFTSPNVHTAAPAPLLRVFRHRRLTVLLTILLSVASAAIYVVRTPAIYSSSARVYVSCLCTPPAGAAAAFGDGFPFLCYQAQQMRSVPVLSKALAAINPVSLKTFTRTDSPVLYLQNNLNIETDRVNDTVTVTMNSRFRQDPAPSSTRSSTRISLKPTPGLFKMPSPPPAGNSTMPSPMGKMPLG